MVCVKHFLKHNDDRRLDPVCMIKSFAFQLALQLPAVAKYILGLDVQTVDQLRDMGDAYNLLIEGAIPMIADHQVIILIDALDEADPQEQQRADYDYKLHGIEPVGNKVTHCVYSLMYINRLTQSQSSVLTVTITVTVTVTITVIVTLTLTLSLPLSLPLTLIPKP